jgi:hypothetical protein
MTPAPKWFFVVAVVALLWNLLGCMAFASDAMMTKEAIAKLSENEQALYNARPAWSIAATGVAVVAGALGCVALLLRKRWATPLLGASLLGVLGQDISLFGMAPDLSAINPAVFVLQGMVLLIAIGLLILSLRAGKLHWIG